jgi:RNase P subunit RPR2
MDRTVTTKKELPEGYTCKCGEFHKYPAYVYAHWRDLLTHTCEKCGAKHDILMGHASPHK